MVRRAAFRTPGGTINRFAAFPAMIDLMRSCGARSDDQAMYIVNSCEAWHYCRDLVDKQFALVRQKCEYETPILKQSLECAVRKYSKICTITNLMFGEMKK